MMSHVCRITQESMIHIFKSCEYARLFWPSGPSLHCHTLSLQLIIQLPWIEQVCDPYFVLVYDMNIQHIVIEGDSFNVVK